MKKIAGILFMIFFMAGVWSNEIHASNPNDLIVGLINTVKSLHLHSGIENSLLAKLQAAQKGLLSTNPKHYKNSVKPLEAFKNEVRALSGKHIPQAGAIALLAQADNLIRIILGTASQNIGTAGGSLLITDKTSEIYGTSVSVPPGALPSATLITVVQEPNPPPMPTNLSSTGPAVTFGPEGTNFVTPVTIAIPYKEPEINENDLKLFTFDKITETWIDVTINSRDTLNNILYAQVTHFSTFQVGVQPPEVDPDAPHFEWVVVWSQTTPTGNELFLAASVIDGNGDVPWTIKSLTVQGPENFLYKFSHLDYYFDIPLGKGIYRVTLPLISPPKSGDYTFTVEDVEEKITSRTKNLTAVMPIPLVSKTTFDPPDRADSGSVSTTPTLSWSPVFYEKPVYYRVFMHNQNRHVIYRSHRFTGNQFVIPDDLLHENAIYYWRVEAFDADNGLVASNISRSDLAIFATRNLSLTNSPIFESPRVWTDNDAGRRQYFLHLGGQLRRGISGPILSCSEISDSNFNIKVTDQSGSEFSIIPIPTDPFPVLSAGCFDLYSYFFIDIQLTDPPDIPTGEYIFRAIDKFGNRVQFGDFLNEPKKLPVPVQILPADNSILNPTPTFIWEPVEGARTYQINIDKLDGTSWIRVFESPRSTETTYTYSTSDPPLNPNTRYRWRVRAFDGRYFSEIDNRSTSRWREFTVDENAPYFKYAVVWNEAMPGANYINIAALVIDPNGYIAPDSQGNNTITSVTVTGPNNFYRSFNPKNPIFLKPEPWNDWIYGGLIAGNPDDGRYIFQVVDIEGKTGIAYKDLIVNPVPVVDKDTLQPTDGAILSTTPTLSWTPVSDPRPLYYRVRIQESMGGATWSTLYDSPFTTASIVTIPSNVLMAGSSYRWRARAFDGSSIPDVSNVSSSDWVYFTTETIPDPNAPYFNSVAVWNDSYPPPIGAYNLNLSAIVKDPNGYVNPFPSNTIASLTVSGPNNFTYSFNPKNPFFYIPLGDWMYASPLISGIPDVGTYVFQVTDIEGKTGLAYKDFVVHPVPIVDKSTFNLSDGSTVSIPPTLRWEPVIDSRTIYYRVRITDFRNTIIYDSPLSTQTSVTIPTGLLLDGQTYYWRVQAFDASRSAEASNRSNSAWANFYFSTGAPPVCSGVYDDFDGENINSTLWYIYDSCKILSQSEDYLHGGGPPYSCYGWLHSRRTFSGDFEFVLEYSDYLFNPGQSGVESGPRISLQANLLSSSDHVGIVFGGTIHGKGIGSGARVNGEWREYTSVQATSNSGLLKISRIGSTITTYFDEGSGWVSLGNFTNAFSGPVYAQVQIYSGDGGECRISSGRIHVNAQTCY